jgi:hypothetical protein
VHTTCLTASQDSSHHIKCWKPYAVIYGLELLRMGIMLSETCSANGWLINHNFFIKLVSQIISVQSAFLPQKLLDCTSLLFLDNFSVADDRRSDVQGDPYLSASTPNRLANNPPYVSRGLIFVICLLFGWWACCLTMTSSDNMI